MHLYADNFIMHYDEPATNYLSPKPSIQRDVRDFMQEALPIGNGHLGAMISGGIDKDLIVVNDISAWKDSTRGDDVVSQTGTPKGAYKYLAELKEKTRNSDFGSSKNSIEAFATKHFSSKMKLGNYASFTDLSIETGHNPNEAKNYKRALNLKTGIFSASYEIGNSKFTREVFCSYPNDLIAIKYTSSKEPLNLKIQATSKHKGTICSIKKNRVELLGKIPLAKKDYMEFKQILHIEKDKGEISSDSENLYIKGAKEITIYLVAYTDYLPKYPDFKGRNYAQDCEKTLSKALKLSYNKIKEAHTKDISLLMNRCSLDLNAKESKLTTDKLVKQGESLELASLYFNYARYLQTACSRDSYTPSNLQGIWNNYVKPAWNCDYHNDINLAMNYWMTETTNLTEMFVPYANWMKIISESGKYSAKEGYGINRGWTAGLNSNVFGFSAQNQHGRRTQHSGAWLSQNLYEHFSFSRDKNYLAEIYPIIKGAAEFYLDFLDKWKDGTLLIYPTWSAENTFLAEKYGDLNKLSYGASTDQQLIYNLFVDCIEASVLLNKDEKFRAELKKIIPKLCPQKIGSFGQLQEWADDMDKADDRHRHISHLIALYPARDISPFANKDLAKAAFVTMRQRDGDNSGWASAWRIALWARLFQGDRALAYYNDLYSKRANPNLLNGSDIFQVDGNFGGAAGIVEMLVQSHLRSINNNATKIEEAVFPAYKELKPKNFAPIVPNDSIATAPHIIHLLPALPKKWKDGKLMGLRARGGFEVDLIWKDGKVTNARIHSKAGEGFRLYLNGKLSSLIRINKGESIYLEEIKF